MYTIKEKLIANDLDTMVNIVNNDEGHIRRAKEKAKKAEEDARKAYKKAVRVSLDKKEIEENARLAVLVTAIATFSQIIANSMR